MVKKLWRYVKPFSSDTGKLRTDGRTDRQTERHTDLLYQYRALVFWRAIKIAYRLLIGTSCSFDDLEWPWNLNAVQWYGVWNQRFLPIVILPIVRLCQKRCKIRSKLLLFTNRKSLRCFDWYKNRTFSNGDINALKPDRVCHDTELAWHPLCTVSNANEKSPTLKTGTINRYKSRALLYSLPETGNRKIRYQIAARRVRKTVTSEFCDKHQAGKETRTRQQQALR